MRVSLRRVVVGAVGWGCSPFLGGGMVRMCCMVRGWVEVAWGSVVVVERRGCNRRLRL